MERGEFISYVEREQAHLRRFLLALCCGNADEADDIAQDALVKAYLSSSSYNDEGKFGVWICKIAYNTFLDRKRASKQSDTLDDATLVQDDTFAADRAYEYQDLYKAIAALPVKERTAILLYYIKGYSIKEIASITDGSDDAVKKQLSRARMQLKSKLGDYGKE